MRISAKTFSLTSKYPFKIAHGTRFATDTFIVEIEHNGHIGLGEATPVPYYGVTTQSMYELLQIHKERLESIPWNHPSDFWKESNTLLNNTFLQCAIDTALYDVWAKKQSKTLRKALSLGENTTICSDYTIGIDTVDIMVKKMLEYRFPIYKIKLGTPDDIGIVKELRKHTSAIFRIDANGAWEPDEALENMHVFKNMGVEFIEQPLAKNNWEGMMYLKSKTPLSLIADESCMIETDVNVCSQYFNGINIKLAKCGGITPALRMIENGRSLGMKIMMGCMTESSIGISALGQLTPLLDFVDMDGAMLINNDPAEGVYLDKGKIIFPDRNGHGGVWKS
ncbi:MAG: dipeptide epimerase [Leadbetterella sp.]